MTTKLPIITASLLAEYCFASAPRRRAILELMYNDTFEPFKLWYGEVPGAYRQYVASQCLDDCRLKSLEDQLIKREAMSDDDDQKALKQLDALEHIRNLDHSKLLHSAHATQFDHNLRRLVVSGVTVRVNPTNILTASQIGSKTLAVGVLKPHLKASRALPDEEGRLFAAILHWFVESTLQHVGVAEPSLCAVSDVFARNIHFAPPRYKKLRSTIQANCEEIAGRWQSFTPRHAAAKGAA